ncbi:hypothetical protein AB0280_17425 [Pseudarthrobacter sp902506025]|uniref:Uncharacterized protein n=1 Tax=Pseudarthrobacter defluvii TaxID=410837 RepID=A0ABT9UED2_9MICC|nr:hypothetical protein [Pseudarthrobacter defluvii]MDQ0117996.1 hypothetical protein [Pseudarthrobacter defluvii]
MTFFQDFPVPPLPPRPRTTSYVPPPWAAAPVYELPAAVHVGRFLSRTPGMVVAIRSADVFSTGCLFNLSWVFRRAEQTEEDWADLQHLFFQPGRGIRRGSGRQTGLMFGVEFPDGSKASTGVLGPHGLMERGQEPEPPTLVLNNGGGSGGDDEFSGSGTLWLWPLPPAGDLRLVAQWTDFGMEETSLMLDGGALRQAAASVQPYWQEEENNG